MLHISHYLLNWKCLVSIILGKKFVAKINELLWRYFSLSDRKNNCNRRNHNEVSNNKEKINEVEVTHRVTTIMRLYYEPQKTVYALDSFNTNKKKSVFGIEAKNTHACLIRTQTNNNRPPMAINSTTRNYR